jgi:hypothetical protein
VRRRAQGHGRTGSSGPPVGEGFYIDYVASRNGPPIQAAITL